MENIAATIPLQKTTLLWRGVCGHCPKCGEGAIFKSYLKQNDACPVCGEDFSRFHADDGPAWFTILLTLHIVVPTAVTLATYNLMPQWADITLLLTLTLASVFLLLPRTKGVFIAILWYLARKKLEAQKTP